MISRRRVASSAVLHFIFLLLLQLTTFQTFQLLVAADVLPMERRLSDDDHSAGFINIDCGSAEPGPTYNPETGLYCISDEKYINTGSNSLVSPTYYSKYPKLFRTLRSFPEGRRNCYNLYPLKPNHTYLIRAQFMYGNYDGKNSTPTFDVYIGVNFWFTVSLYITPYKEIIHVATAKSIDVCLVNTGQGTPYINSLELRPLDINTPYVASPAFSLQTQYRNDLGGLADQTSNYNVKDDAYDRLWYRSPAWSGWKVINTTNGTFDASQPNPCKVPISVLMTACGQNEGDPNWTLGTATSDSISKFHFYWHFAELELLRLNETREFNIFVRYAGYKSGPIRPKYLQVTTVVSPRFSLNESTSNVLSYTLEKTNESTHYPILNAVELYKVLQLPASPTNQEDVDSITAIKDGYVIPKIWQGDPCLPKDYQWDGLNCSYDGIDPPRIISLSLNSSNLTGEIPPSLSKLTSLKYLNLSNNGLTGKIPEFLANMPLLNVIDLTGNNLMGPVPPLLVEKAHNKSMDLRLEGNYDDCKSYPCHEVSKKRHHFNIIPVVTSVALVSLLAIIGIIFLAFKMRKKPERLVDRSIKPRNKQFKFSEIVRITDNFKKVLGKGGFGTVYYGVLQDDTEVAVKLLNNMTSTITVTQFCDEAELVMGIHHVNLVSLIGYCDEHANMALVYEYMSRGTIHMHLFKRNEPPLSWKRRLEISIDASQGLEYLHNGCQPKIVHRDVKPANILMDEMGRAKIADFGLCRHCPTTNLGAPMTNVAGTLGYVDPEYLKLQTLSQKSDVYGFGIVLLQLLTGQPTFIQCTSDEEPPTPIITWVSPIVESGDILAIVDERLQGDFNVSCAMKFFEIAMECVKPTGKQRPRMSEVVARLKLCYTSEGFDDQPSLASVDNGSHNQHSIQGVLDSSLTCTLPR